jgi:tRNA A37 threonylcarbamoyladenosine synthetase subunit TsaC/SUA5/YrdC
MQQTTNVNIVLTEEQKKTLDRLRSEQEFTGTAWRLPRSAVIQKLIEEAGQKFQIDRST